MVWEQEEQHYPYLAVMKCWRMVQTCAQVPLPLLLLVVVVATVVLVWLVLFLLL
jgi:hypothetical protein